MRFLRKILGFISKEADAMTRIKKERFGLPVDVWVSPRMASHGPRIKVATRPGSTFGRKDSLTLSIEDQPKVLNGDAKQIPKRDLDTVKAWIARNKTVLLKHWTEGYDDLDLLSDLTK